MGETGPYLTSVIVLGFFRHSFSVVLTNPINPEGKVPFDKDDIDKDIQTCYRMAIKSGGS